VRSDEKPGLTDINKAFEEVLSEITEPEG